MSEYNLPKDSQIIVVRADELADRTSKGWQLVSSYQETVPERLEETELVQAQPSQGYYASTMNVLRHHPVTTTYFVLRKDAATVIEELQVKLTEVQNSLVMEKIDHDKTRSNLDSTKGTINQARGRVSTLEGQVSTLQVDRNSWRDKATRLEDDLGKVRTAIGERQFREILPLQPKPT